VVLHHLDQDTQVVLHHLHQEDIQVVLHHLHQEDTQEHQEVTQDSHMVELLHLTRDTDQLEEQQVVEDILQQQELIPRCSSGSMQWTRTGVDRLTSRSCRGRWSMVTGATSARRRAG